jgi:hypothetical protein
MSVGFTIGASTTKLVGRAINLKGRLRLRVLTARSEPAVRLRPGLEAFNCRMAMA